MAWFQRTNLEKNMLPCQSRNMDADYHAFAYQIYQNRFPMLVPPELVPSTCPTCKTLKVQCQKMYEALDTLQRYCTVLLQKQTPTLQGGGGNDDDMTQEDWDRCSSALVQLIPTGRTSSLGLVQKMLTLLREESTNETVDALKNMVQTEMERLAKVQQEQKEKDDQIRDLQAKMVLLEQKAGTLARENAALKHKVVASMRTPLQ